MVISLKKKSILIAVSLFIIATFLSFMAFEGKIYAADGQVDLLAGQNINVGTVTVTNDAGNLYVEYKITDPNWCISETHVHVGDSLDDFPLAGKQKNPVPGQFDYSMKHDPCVTEYTVTIPISADWGTTLKIAAHAVVEKCEVESFSFVPELTWQRSSEVGVAVYPGYGAQWTKEQGFAIELDPEATVWDGGTLGQYFTGYSTRSDISWASWVCTQNLTGKSTAGTDLRRFQATFDIPAGYTVTSGTLGSVNTGYENVIPMNDNIYVFVNEELLFWGGTISLVGLDPTRTTFLGMERRPTQPQNKTAFPETDGWYMDGTFPVISSGLLSEGENVLDVFAEELWTGGGMHELGLTLQVEQVTCETETAWAAGTRFTSKGNWATYFTYTVQATEPTFVETVTVDSANMNGESSLASLAAGKNYLFEVSGVWQNRGWEKVDAKYTTGDNWGTNTDAPSGGYPNQLLDLQVNNTFMDWGAYSSSHTYTMNFVGNDLPVNFRVFDGDVSTNTLNLGWYSDNIGNLTVNIYKVN